MSKKIHRINTGNMDVGISIEHNTYTKMITISGWYDRLVNIEPTTMPVNEFCTKLKLRKPPSKKFKKELFDFIIKSYYDEV